MAQQELVSYPIAVAALADWLIAQGDDLWWTIDGEEEFASTLKLPCPTDELVSALRARGGQVLVVAPQGHELPAGTDLSPNNLGSLAVREGEARVFQLAWPDNGHDVWVLIEDTIAKDAIDATRE